MSFDVNIGRAEPIIKAAAGMNNDGGSGGNLGYMTGGGGRQKNKDHRGSLFEKENLDSFEMSSKLPKSEKDFLGEESSWINKLLKKLK